MHIRVNCIKYQNPFWGTSSLEEFLLNVIHPQLFKLIWLPAPSCLLVPRCLSIPSRQPGAWWRRTQPGADSTHSERFVSGVPRYCWPLSLGFTSGSQVGIETEEWSPLLWYFILVSFFLLVSGKFWAIIMYLSSFWKGYIQPGPLHRLYELCNCRGPLVA